MIMARGLFTPLLCLIIAKYLEQMKNLKFLMAAIVAVAVMSSCGGSSPKAEFKNELDSLSYAIGLANTQGLRPFLEQSGVDSTLMSEFIRGFNEGATVSKDDKKKNAYLLGIDIGKRIGTNLMSEMNGYIFSGDSTQALNKNNVIAGFIAGTLEKDMKMSVDTIQQYIQETVEFLQSATMEKQYGPAKAEGLKFLEDNKAQEGVVALPSGLQYKVITAGKGKVPVATDLVKVNYRGTLIDGTEFDNSYERGIPAEFYANGVINGWTEALTMMPVGSKWMLYIPYDLAYGTLGSSPNIPPFATLIFEVELLSIAE